jgi:CRP-like cAMP-binding protein
VPSVANTLIGSLPRVARDRLLALCEPVDLVSEEVLSIGDIPTRHVYFPTGSIVSLTTSMKDAPVLEVGMIGSEGMLGAQIALGIPSGTLQARVSRSGSAWRVPARPFNGELMRSGALQRSLNRYLHVIMLHLVSDVRCLRFHQLDQRLARWLLMTHDRTHTDSFSVTHELIAHLMGVRRVGITNAAGALQQRGIIHYVRGDLTIVDRKALELEACGCYAAERKVYAHFLPQKTASTPLCSATHRQSSRKN